MFKRIKLSLIGAFVAVGLVGGVVGATIPVHTASAAECTNSFLTFPAWYRGVINESDCSINFPGNSATGEDVGSELTTFIWTIALNVIEIIMQIIGYVAIFFMIYGGFLYMTSAGNPDGAAKGLKTIINAAIGIAIGMSAIALKNLVWRIVVEGSASTQYGVPTGSAESVLVAVLNTVYFVAGAVAVTVIVISGLTYVTSSGNASKVTKAKSSLLYAVVGLIIVLAAAALTTFVAGRID